MFSWLKLSGHNGDGEGGDGGGGGCEGVQDEQDTYIYHSYLVRHSMEFAF